MPSQMDPQQKMQYLLSVPKDAVYDPSYVPQAQLHEQQLQMI